MYVWILLLQQPRSRHLIKLLLDALQWFVPLLFSRSHLVRFSRSSSQPDRPLRGFGSFRKLSADMRWILHDHHVQIHSLSLFLLLDTNFDLRFCLSFSRRPSHRLDYRRLHSRWRCSSSHGKLRRFGKFSDGGELSRVVLEAGIRSRRSAVSFLSFLSLRPRAVR